MIKYINSYIKLFMSYVLVLGKFALKNILCIVLPIHH